MYKVLFIALLVTVCGADFLGAIVLPTWLLFVMGSLVAVQWVGIFKRWS